MEINGLKVNKIKKMFGVEVPERYFDKPEKAIEYIAGFLAKDAKGWIGDNGKIDLIRIPEILREVVGKYGNPRDHSAFVNPDAGVYREGYIIAGGDLCLFPRGSFLKNSSVEHEKDLVELLEMMERNPSFIPHYAWPGWDGNKGTRSDRNYHFS